MQTVLHLERSSFFQKIIRDMIKPFGYEVVSTASVKEGLKELANHQKFAMVLSGLELEDGRAQDFVTAMNQRDLNIPVVVVTSNESLELRQELFSLGVTDYILKQDLDSGRLVSYIKKIAQPDRALESMKDIDIAIVDDSKLEQQIMKTILELHDITRVQIFPHAKAALASNKKFDLYIIDLVMPEVNGEELVRELRARYKDVMLIVASSINHSKTVAHVLESGANDYIAKPFEAELFMARLKSTVRTWLLMKDLTNKQIELTKLAETDGLTGIFNHRAIIERIKTSMAITARPPLVGIMLMDLDNFKKVNDTYGHPAGDEVLVSLCQTVAKGLPPDCQVGRYGGEEFLVIFRGLTRTEAKDSALKMLEAFSALEITENKIKSSFSAGLALYKNQSLTDLVKMADAALYEAKHRGKNQVLEVE